MWHVAVSYSLFGVDKVGLCCFVAVLARCSVVQFFSKSKALNPLLSYVYTLSYSKVNCSLTLRENHRLRVFENRVKRGIFGPNRDKTL
jgi:hypothetical protein